MDHDFYVMDNTIDNTNRTLQCQHFLMFDGNNDILA